MKKCANKTEKNEKSDINTQSYMCLLFCVLCLLCVFSFCSNKIGLLLVSMASVPDSSSDVAILGVLEIIKLRCVQEACCPVGDRLNSMSGVEPVDPSMPSVEPVDGPPVDLLWAAGGSDEEGSPGSLHLPHRISVTSNGGFFGEMTVGGVSTFVSWALFGCPNS